MIFHKRGVSPLIATVLLVMIVVSIGAAVMVVIQSLSEEQLQSASAQQALIQCGVDVDVGLIEVSDSNRLCLDFYSASDQLSKVTLYMENKGLKNIQGWRFTIVGADGIYDVTDQGVALSRGSLTGFNFTFNNSGVASSVGEIDLIRLSPRVEGGATNPVVTCTEPNLEWDADAIADWQNCSASTVTWDDNI